MPEFGCTVFISSGGCGLFGIRPTIPSHLGVKRYALGNSKSVAPSESHKFLITSLCFSVADRFQVTLPCECSHSTVNISIFCKPETSPFFNFFSDIINNQRTILERVSSIARFNFASLPLKTESIVSQTYSVF